MFLRAAEKGPGLRTLGSLGGRIKSPCVRTARGAIALSPCVRTALPLRGYRAGGKFAVNAFAGKGAGRSGGEARRHLGIW